MPRQTRSLAALLLWGACSRAAALDWNAPFASGLLTPMPAKTASVAPAPPEYPEAVSKAPRSDVNPIDQVTSRACQSREEGYSVCRLDAGPEIDSFYFANQGGNAVVREPYDPVNVFPQRWFEFHFQEQARQDLYFTVSDIVSGRISQAAESYFMVFPRNVVPSIVVAQDRYVVTLPTGEAVLFNAKTKEITGGALAEKGSQKPGVFAKIAYTGNGVLLRADRMGEDPRVKTTATATRGSSNCAIPTRELWSGNSVVHFKFPTDEGFDRFLRARCGFGLP